MSHCRVQNGGRRGHIPRGPRMGHSVHTVDGDKADSSAEVQTFQPPTVQSIMCTMLRSRWQSWPLPAVQRTPTGAGSRLKTVSVVIPSQRERPYAALAVPTEREFACHFGARIAWSCDAHLT